MVNIPKYVGIRLVKGRNTDEMLLVGPAEHVSLELDLGMACQRDLMKCDTGGM